MSQREKYKNKVKSYSIKVGGLYLMLLLINAYKNFVLISFCLLIFCIAFGAKALNKPDKTCQQFPSCRRNIH